MKNLKVFEEKASSIGNQVWKLKDKGRETISSYNERISEIVNESHSLGDPIFNTRLVHKFFRTVTKCFDAKIWIIEEDKDTDL